MCGCCFVPGHQLTAVCRYQAHVSSSQTDELVSRLPVSALPVLRVIGKADVPYLVEAPAAVRGTAFILLKHA